MYTQWCLNYINSPMWVDLRHECLLSDLGDMRQCIFTSFVNKHLLEDFLSAIQKTASSQVRNSSGIQEMVQKTVPRSSLS